MAIPNQSFLIFRKINHFLLKYQVEYFLRKNNFTEIIIWTFSPYWIEVIEKLGYKLLIFHCVDGLHTYDSSAHFLNSFNRLSEVADMIFTPGLLLHSELKEINQNTFMIGHGVKEENILNQQDFTDLILPSELKGTARDKVVVYSGTLANWVDYELLYKCAEELEDHIFILIGYVHALSPSQEVRDLHKLRNIIFTGYKSYEELPSYYLFSSIGIVPYQANNEHIQYSTPTKFLDYFAFGLEVVSTNFPSAKNLEPLVKVANNHEEFIKLIKDISSSPTSDKINETAISYACSHTWEIQVAKMLEQIENQFNV